MSTINPAQFRRNSTSSGSVSSVSIEDLPTYDLNKVKTDQNGGISKGGVAVPFPWRVHEMLEAVEKEGLQHIVAFLPHGRAFKVFQPKLFVELIMPR